MSYSWYPPLNEQTRIENEINEIIHETYSATTIHTQAIVNYKWMQCVKTSIPPETNKKKGDHFIVISLLKNGVSYPIVWLYAALRSKPVWLEKSSPKSSW